MRFFSNDSKKSGPPAAGPPPLADSLRAAAADLAKQAKLQLAAEAIPIRQLNEIAAAELRDTAALKAKHLGEEFRRPAGPPGADMGDMIICDNYSKGNVAAGGRSFPWLPAIAAAAGVGLGGVLPLAALLFSGILSRSVSIETKTRTVEPQEFEVQIWTESGKPKVSVSPVPLSK